MEDELHDGFDSTLECNAWKKAPRVIGSPAHTHVCREATQHDGPHTCGCTARF
jgi:hypothetical protein